MRRDRRLSGVLIAVLGLSAADASAQASFSGTLNSSDATMNVVSIVDRSCDMQSATPVRFETFFFTVPISARYTLRITGSNPAISSFYLYQGAFDPLHGTMNCIAATSAIFGHYVTEPLMTGTTYYLVPINDTVDLTATNTYTVTVSPALGKAVDFSNDNRSDLAIVRNTGGGPSGAVTWFISDTATLASTVISWGIATDTFVPADYDGDGKTDAAIWRRGPAGVAGFWIKQSSDGAVRFHLFGQDGDQPYVVGDYDGDGMADIAVYRPGAGSGDVSTWFYKRSIDGVIVGTVWGQNGDFPAPGDYDGDGKYDFAVQRTAGGGSARFWILHAAGGVATVIFGAPTDVIVPGDYDGDGKSDLAVTRYFGGSWGWFVRSSATGSISSMLFGNGATDFQIMGDYDADGKTDIAVWRPGTPGFFFVNKSTGGMLVRGWGINQDYPVANFNAR